MAQKVSEYYMILRKRHSQRLEANCVMPEENNPDSLQDSHIVLLTQQRGSSTRDGGFPIRPADYAAFLNRLFRTR